MKKYIHIPVYTKVRSSFHNFLYLIKGALLLPFFLLLSRIKNGPGVNFYFNILILWLNRFNYNRIKFWRFLLMPMDSFRYFEFDFFWGCIKKDNIQNCLDISSPRLFILNLFNKIKKLHIDILNPDKKDLDESIEIIKEFGFSDRCNFYNKLMKDFDNFDTKYDLICSISVIEHIPINDNADIEAIKKMWGLLNHGGKLLISVPCCAIAFEEYLDYNEYGILPMNNNFVFGQRFYDTKLIEERIFSITGKHRRFKICGERDKDIFIENRERKWKDNFYPFWKESYIMATDYKYYNSIDQLPYTGVICMEFVKDENSRI